jgi:threonine dehydratase
MDSASDTIFEVDAAAALSRISPHVQKTPVAASQWLSQSSAGKVFLKLENLQPTGSFKLRGAANRLLSLTPDEARRGIVTASNGNHAVAVATMGRKLGLKTEVFVSASIDALRLQRILASGAFVRRTAGDYLMAEQAARREAELGNRVYVSPYNDLTVIAGQGTIAVELLEQLPRLNAVFVAVGGGGLIGGIGAHLKRVSPGTEVVGCWPEHSPVLYECLRAKRILTVDEKPTLSVSTAGNVEPDSVTLSLGLAVIDRSVLVSEEEILHALRGCYKHDGQLLEGAAGVALAGFRKVAADYAGKTVAVILCGGNPDATLQKLIEQE